MRTVGAGLPQSDCHFHHHLCFWVSLLRKTNKNILLSKEGDFYHDGSKELLSNYLSFHSRVAASLFALNLAQTWWFYNLALFPPSLPSPTLVSLDVSDSQRMARQCFSGWVRPGKLLKLPGQLKTPSSHNDHIMANHVQERLTRPERWENLAQ